KVMFTLENTGQEEIEVITARNSGASPSNHIQYQLMDEDDNTLAAAPFQQGVGETIITLANKNSVARIPAGQTFTSDWTTLPIPVNAPDRMFIRLSISTIYHHQGKSDQVVMTGLSTNHEVSLVDTSYYGVVADISPESSMGDEEIVISGLAIERSTGQPMANVPLNLVITVKGFERENDVYTDDQGAFTHAFTPLPGESGVYTVRAIHPDLLDRPVHGQFTVYRVRVSPT
ncbi:MAG: hypothetical protein GY859_34100, partial [Desulfobacterales bacterium]|nr:hypothetical protein [Desulfobacterales bacterium]